MPRCPKCSYTLVLLEKRGKYKCAKCGRLFPQRVIDDSEFREWNKDQREKDRDDFERQRKLRRKRLKPRKAVNPEEKQRKVMEYRAVYYAKNRDKILVQKKAYPQNAKESNNHTRRLYRQSNKDLVGVWCRIHYWRQMQKKLALLLFKRESELGTSNASDGIT